MKKILTIVISIALVAAIAIGGTFAYLTSNAGGTTLTNTFVSGPGLSITLDETPVDAYGQAASGDRVTSNTYPIIPGEVMDKDPQITVQANSQACYVFAYVTNTATIKLGSADALPVVTDINIDTDNWHVAASNTNGTLYVYSTAVNAPIIVDTSDSDYALPEVFTEITINDDITVADLAGIRAGSVTVQAYAYQATTGVTYASALSVVKGQFHIV